MPRDDDALVRLAESRERLLHRWTHRVVAVAIVLGLVALAGIDGTPRGPADTQTIAGADRSDADLNASTSTADNPGLPGARSDRERASVLADYVER